MWVKDGHAGGRVGDGASPSDSCRNRCGAANGELVPEGDIDRAKLNGGYSLWFTSRSDPRT
jgi:hypothetical protein